MALIHIERRHAHEWKVIMAEALARYEKQDGQGTVVYCRGRIEQCVHAGCPVWRIVPFDNGYSPVEIEPPQAAA